MGKKIHDVHVKLDKDGLETLSRVARAMGYETKTDAVRNLLRLANVLFDERLTVNVAVQPFFLEMLLNDGEFRNKVPLIHMLKPIPELEKELGGMEPLKIRRKKKGR